MTPRLVKQPKREEPAVPAPRPLTVTDVREWLLRATPRDPEVERVERWLRMGGER